jgi:hypothetical protein
VEVGGWDGRGERCVMNHNRPLGDRNRCVTIHNAAVPVSTFLGPNGTRYDRCHFRAQKSLDYRAHPFKSIRPALYKQ